MSIFINLCFVDILIFYLTKIVSCITSFVKLITINVKGKTMIYFIQQGDSGPIKIGYTNNISKRINALQSSSPEKLHLLGAIEGDKDRERVLQKFFHAHKMQGEWFKPAPMVLNYIFGLIARPEDTIIELTVPRTDIIKIENLDEMLSGFETKIIKTALTYCNGNLVKTAKTLDISLRSLRYRIEKLHIDRDKFIKG